MREEATPVTVSALPGSQISRDWRPWLLGLSATVIACDRLSKHWIEKHVAVGRIIRVIPHTFYISHVENTGAAFSLFGDSSSPSRVRWMLIGFSLLASILVLAFLLRMGRRLSLTAVALALILGGAIGNVIDRIRNGYVTDFLWVQLHAGHWHYHWPDFNVADSSIVIGGVLLMLDALRGARAS